MTDVSVPMTRRRKLIQQHIPSLTIADEDEMFRRHTAPYSDEELDYGLLAVRTCHCGETIDGFYEYADHIQKVLEEAGL